MSKSTNPAAAENNRHHQGGYHSEREFLDELLGRGPGDPDIHGYPGEHEASQSDPKGPSQNTKPLMSITTKLTTPSETSQNSTGPSNKL